MKPPPNLRQAAERAFKENRQSPEFIRALFDALPPEDQQAVRDALLGARPFCTPAQYRAAMARAAYQAARGTKSDIELAEVIAARWRLSITKFWNAIGWSQLGRLSKQLKTLCPDDSSTDSLKQL